MKPIIAIPNIFGQDAKRLASFAKEHGIKGVEWSLDLEDSPEKFLDSMNALEAFEVRFHARFFGVDLAYQDERVKASMEIFKSAINQIAMAGGTHLTVHIGLGHESMDLLSWQKARNNLGQLVNYGARKGVIVSLENLAKGWTSDPYLFYQLIQGTGASVTLDIGHAHAASRGLEEPFYQGFILHNRDRIVGAHIYNTELEGIGHIPPDNIGKIRSRLDLLSLCPCDWWVVELFNPKDVLHTKELLEAYLREKEGEVELGLDVEYTHLKDRCLCLSS